MQSSPSVCPSVRLFPLSLRNRLTVDLELLHVSRSYDHSWQGIEDQGHRSKSRSWAGLLRSVRPRWRAAISGLLYEINNN